ncbi:SusC/RagA family TonB-linked outer membrane protein [Arachidicoccus ginsenosidivorans]|uniref:SusC/RagA family TonB-linked outer membrane protein n=1 Tax=Arachidicoccus ginsenosidivorans TaxID=496057 RepID=UPI001CEFA437|nr:SusC/RagA family TonB-linked outer membrane protein [Arachidicoccus ginsenosidivorans]
MGKASAAYNYQKPGQQITGLVTDTTGTPLAGVSVYAKDDSRHGTITDPNGKFVLTISQGSIIVFNMTGYDSQQLQVTDSSNYHIVLRASTNDLQDAVVIAFGKEKRADVVGSVVSVNPADLKVPASNLTTALAGKIPGMIAFQRSGEPGADNANFFVRGVSTFGTASSPLILIDGVESSTTDLARLQVDDIASFSVLKDATATALYGSRAANGVLLIATKQGKAGTVRINFRAENSVSAPTSNVEFADPITYMNLANEAALTRDPLAPPPYTEEKIDNTISGVNPYVYPTNDWRKLMFKDQTTTQRFNLSLSGGGGVAQYYVSGSYNKDNGLMKVDKRNNFNSNISLNSYSLRSNIDVNVTKTTKLTLRLSGSFDDYNGPVGGSEGVSVGTALYNEVVHTNPVLFPAYYPVDSAHSYVKHILFGNYGNGGYLNPYADIVKGYQQYSRTQLQSQLEFNQDFDFLVKGLSFNAMLNIGRYSYFDVSRQYNPFYYTLQGYNVLDNSYLLTELNPTTGTEYLNYSEGNRSLSTSLYLQTRVNYTHSFNGKHNINGMLVYMVENRLNANAGSLQLSLPYRNLGLSGRFTYDYDKRYYLEFNFGYNGSERFDQNHRFGFFPSAGAAWTVSNEAFFEPLKDVVTNLKLRATYGLIGNDAIGSGDDRFFYLSNVNMNDDQKGATFGTDLAHSLNGISISRYADPNITWETSTQKNFAMDLSLFGSVDITAEYYTQKGKIS